MAASGRPRLAQALAQRRDDGAAGAQTVGTAAQDRGIAGFQAQRAGIRRHIRPALIDDADDTERHAHPLDGHAVRPFPGFGDGADRVLERAYGLDRHGDGLDAVGIEGQAVEKSGRHAGAFSPRRHPRHWRRESAPLARAPLPPWPAAPCLFAPQGPAPGRGRRRARSGRFPPWRRLYRLCLQRF